jgi:hypothetical protein
LRNRLTHSTRAKAVLAVFGARKIDGAQQIRAPTKNTAHNPRLVPITDERRFFSRWRGGSREHVCARTDRRV